MLKVVLITTLLSGSPVSQVDFDSMDKCLEHRQEIVNQSDHISAVCVYKDKDGMDELVENVSRKLLIVFQVHLTKILNEHLRE